MKALPRAVPAGMPASWLLKHPSYATLTRHQQLVFSLVCEIPEGKVSTYGAVADGAGSCARAVGQAMRNNPLAPDVP
jgi:methylated-DNA-[protein]-cysteine S-methyltransferase